MKGEGDQRIVFGVSGLWVGELKKLSALVGGCFDGGAAVGSSSKSPASLAKLGSKSWLARGQSTGLRKLGLVAEG